MTTEMKKAPGAVATAAEGVVTTRNGYETEDQVNTNNFTWLATRNDAIAELIVSVLVDGTTGESIADQYDVEGIADEVLESGEYGPDGSYAYRQRPDIDADTFWGIVDAHELPGAIREAREWAEHSQHHARAVDGALVIDLPDGVRVRVEEDGPAWSASFEDAHGTILETDSAHTVDIWTWLDDFGELIPANRKTIAETQRRNAEVANNLISYAAQHGLGQDDLGKVLNLPQSAMEAVKAGAYPLTVVDLESVASALDVSPSEVLIAGMGGDSVDDA